MPANESRTEGLVSVPRPFTEAGAKGRNVTPLVLVREGFSVKRTWEQGLPEEMPRNRYGDDKANDCTGEAISEPTSPSDHCYRGRKLFPDCPQGFKRVICTYCSL